MFGAGEERMNSSFMDKIICPLSQSAQKYANEPAVIVGARAISFRQLDLCVSSTIKQLKKLGLKKGQRAALVDKNSLESIVVLLSLGRMGVVSVLVSPRLPEDTISTLIVKMNVPIVFTSLKNLLMTKKISTRRFRPEEVINFDIRNTMAGEEVWIPFEQPLTIMFTSGTTTTPKAVYHSFGNHYFNALGSNENIAVGPGDRWLLSLPLYHVGGLGILFRTIQGGGAAVIPTEDDELEEVIAKQKISQVSLVTTQLYRLLKEGSAESLSGLKAILLGGGPIPKALIEQSREKNLPVYITYGLTEMSSQVATCAAPLNKIAGEPHTKVLNYRQVKISAQGEILVKGETLFKGYIEGEKLKLPVDAEGWFATGDLGTLNSTGELKVIGRKDNMFISGGENIHPEEIEGFLKSLNLLEEALVLGQPSKEFGFRPVAFLKIKSSATVEAQILNKELAKSFPKFKIPIHYYSWPKDLESQGIKVSRKVLADLLQNSPSGLKAIS